MSVRSEQGVVLAHVDRYEPASDDVDRSVDGYDPLHHRLVWSSRSGVQVHTPRLSLLVAPRSGLWVPAELPYTVEASTPWWTASFEAATCPPSWHRTVTVELDDVVAPMLAHLARHRSRPWSVPFLSAAVVHLAEAFIDRPAPLPFPIDQRAREVADDLVGDPASQMELADWAPRVAASERTLRRLFLDQTGMPFRRWRLRLRVHTAMRLLADGAAVGDVARRCGYASTTAFARAFATEAGIAPADYAQRALAATDDASHGDDWPSQSTTCPPRRDAPDHPHPQLLEHLTGDDMSGWGRRAALFGVGAALILAACGESDGDDDAATTTASATTGGDEVSETTVEPAGIRTFTDDLGREVEVSVAPQRIVTLHDIQVLRPLLDVGVQPVGSANHQGTPDSYRATESYDADDLAAIVSVGLIGEPNLEQIAALEPDLILGTPSAGTESFTDTLSEIAPTVVLDAGGPVIEYHRSLADVAGALPAYQELLSEYDERVAALRAGLDDVRDELQVSVIGFNDFAGEIEIYEGPHALVARAADLPLLDSQLDFESGEEGIQRYFVSLENVNEHDADVVFLTWYGDPSINDPITSSGLWSTMAAVGADQVIEIDGDTWGTQSVRSLFTVIDDMQDALVDSEIDTSVFP